MTAGAPAARLAGGVGLKVAAVVAAAGVAEASGSPARTRSTRSLRRRRSHQSPRPGVSGSVRSRRAVSRCPETASRAESSSAPGQTKAEGGREGESRRSAQRVRASKAQKTKSERARPGRQRREACERRPSVRRRRRSAQHANASGQRTRTRGAPEPKASRAAPKPAKDEHAASGADGRRKLLRRRKRRRRAPREPPRTRAARRSSRPTRPEARKRSDLRRGLRLTRPREGLGTRKRRSRFHACVSSSHSLSCRRPSSSRRPWQRPARTRPRSSADPTLEGAVVREMNRVRAARGLGPLRAAPRPQIGCARSLAGDARRTISSATTRRDGTAFSERDQEALHERRLCAVVRRRGAHGQPGVAAWTPRRSSTAWLDSPSHRAIILSATWHDTGIGVLYASSAPATFGGTEAIVVTADFGLREGRAGTS